MNAVVRASLSMLPVPVEDGRPVQCVVILRNALWRTAWGMDGCRQPEAFGPVYESAREAAKASHYLNERIR
jgi:hypothetical protein